ncbi:nuclear transport factor 2 family protein [Novosphingobium resinovorum]|uniref:nuclear transport factor 2 family protein n=1 Tax=Novosphingobium TaxID=165696 RepID=UPI001B3C9FAA|nr:MULTISPECIES: nuclear transport factor 2 family protein [Novosphingobium]MBF7014467.1 nuclear transport factor 2 family protein [Novosphingobium sp. HR1a]WJM25052.1 nuclear transport factor 2 family protein [Novosphingobium resinovorum]
MTDTDSRLAALIAKDDIRDLAMRYMRGQDRLDHALQLGTFWPDSTTDYGIFAGSGPDFVDFAQGLLTEHLANQHIIGQHHIQFDEADPNRAFGEVYYYAFHRILDDGVATDLIISGRYLDRYERRDTPTGPEWRFAHRSEFVDWARKDIAADGILSTDLAACLLGRHDTQDRSYDCDWLKNA